MRTYVLDANVLLAFLEGKSSAPKIRTLIDEAKRERAVLFMSAINYGEVYGVLLRLYGRDKARATMSALHPVPITVVDADVPGACRASEVKAQYKFYYADAFAAALAIEKKATLVTSDSDFRRLGHGFPILWLKA